MVASGRGPSKEQGEALLKLLRGHRCFATMLDVADVLRDVLSPMGRLYEAQALIDRDRLVSARDKLVEIQSDLDAGKLDPDLTGEAAARAKQQRQLRSEVLGLQGRLCKQEFVDAYALGDLGAAEQHLRASMVHYEQGYPLDPAWHGPNLAALAWRAGREKFALGHLPDAISIGKRLEDAQRALGPVQHLDPWNISALAQARMAQEDWNGGLDLYQSYIRALETRVGQGAAFMLMGDLRQLQEIWQIDQGGEGARGTTLREMARCILANPDGSVRLTLAAAESLAIDDPAPEPEGHQREAILDDDRTLYSPDVLQKLLDNKDSIGRVRGRPGSGREGLGGSGFVVDAAAIGLEGRGPVLVTNAHVLANDHRHCDATLLSDEAEVTFEGWTKTAEARTFAIEAQEWESLPKLYDISVWRLSGFPDGASLAPVVRRANPYPHPRADPKQRLGTVVPIGHPGGGSLMYTLGSNPIVDHDLHRDQGSPRVVHYKADTKPGSSGCPVFDRSGEVVAIHRASTQSPIPGTPKSHGDGYAANEGIGIHCAARACRGSRA